MLYEICFLLAVGLLSVWYLFWKRKEEFITELVLRKYARAYTGNGAKLSLHARTHTHTHNGESE
jgi:hypothetical protein